MKHKAYSTKEKVERREDKDFLRFFDSDTGIPHTRAKRCAQNPVHARKNVAAHRVGYQAAAEVVAVAHAPSPESTATSVANTTFSRAAPQLMTLRTVLVDVIGCDTMP